MAVTAQFQADFTSFFRGVEEATVHLKSFEEDANKINKSLDRMGDSFSGKKIIQEATLMAKAIEDAGGIAKLTDAELARVGKTANEAADKMKRLGMEVPKNLQDLADATKDAGQETESLGLSVGDMVKAYVSAEVILGIVTSAYHALVDVVQASITSAAEAEEADRALLASLEAQGTAVPSVVEAYRGYAAELQKTTIYSDDAATAAQSMLATFGVMPRDMEKATLAAANLAAKFGKDLPEAAQMIGKAAAGSAESLNKLGIATEDANGKALSFAEIVEKINEKFSGAASAAAETYAGRIQQVKNAWDNVQESIGNAIIQNETVRTLIAEVTGVLGAENDALLKSETVANLVSEAVILLAKAAIPAAEGIQFIGTAALATRTAIDAFAMGLTTAYTWMQKIELQTQKAVNWSLGTEESATRVAEATENLRWADEQMKELDTDMKAAVETNKQWEAGINAMQARISELIPKLEEQKGKHREITATQAENTEVWKLNTGAMGEALITAEEVATATGKLETGFENVGLTLTGLGLKVDGTLPKFAGMQAASNTAMGDIVTGADGAAAAVFKITTEVDGATAAIEQLTAVQSGAQLALPQGGTGEAYAPWAVGHNVNPIMAYELSKRYGTGTVGATANPWTLNPAGGGVSSNTVTLAAGAVQMNYPVMNDPQAMDQLARVVGEAIMKKMSRTGTV